MPEQRSKIDSTKILDSALEMDGTIAPYFNYFDTDYSATNMAYLWQQGAREIVGLKRHWESVHREVIPRSERYRIWVPWFREVLKHDNELGEIQEKVLGGFNDIPCIYTYSQTTGEPIKPKPTPKWDVHQMLHKLGMRMVEFQSQNGNLQGYSHGTELAVSPIAANRLKTIIHEAGHIALGHTLAHTYEEYHTTRGVMEFQAEGVAYVVLNLLGVMDEQTARFSRGYIRHWLRNKKPPEQAVRQVLTVADRILRSGRVTVGDTLEPSI